MGVFLSISIGGVQSHELLTLLMFSGAVLEHEPVGTVVMAVSAVDGDGTYPNNRYAP